MPVMSIKWSQREGTRAAAEARTVGGILCGDTTEVLYRYVYRERGS